MKVFDNIFNIDSNSDYNVYGLNNELTWINILDKFILKNKDNLDFEKTKINNKENLIIE